MKAVKHVLWTSAFMSTLVPLLSGFQYGYSPSELVFCLLILAALLLHR